MRLMCGCDEAVAAWAARELGIESFGPCAAFGVAAEDGRHVGAIVFHNFHPEYRSVEASIATITARWASRSVLRGALSYAFEHLRCRRITAMTPVSRTPALRFLHRLGFRREGQLWCGFGEEDAVISGLRDEDWRASRWSAAGP